MYKELKIYNTASEIKNIYKIEVRITLNNLYVIEQEYDDFHTLQNLSLSRSILKRPDSKGVSLLAQFILLNSNVFDFKIFSHVGLDKPRKGLPYSNIECKFSYNLIKRSGFDDLDRLNNVEIFKGSRNKTYTLDYVDKPFKQKANNLYPFWKGKFYHHIHNPLVNQIYDELVDFKDEIKDCCEHSLILIKCKITDLERIKINL